MRLGPILAACLLWINTVYSRDGSCIFEPCLNSEDVVFKRTVVPRGLHALIGNMPYQLIGRMTGSRLRRLPSEFLGKRSPTPKRVSEFLGKRANKPVNPEFLGKRAHVPKPSELLGKRDQWNADWKSASRNEDYPMVRGERGPRLRFNSGREFLGKRSETFEDETENPEFSTNEEIRDDDRK